jgi:hypothetical protein
MIVESDIEVKHIDYYLEKILLDIQILQESCLLHIEMLLLLVLFFLVFFLP